MALSDWDVCAFGTEGKPSSGFLSIPDKQSYVEIFKGKLHIGSNRAWHRDCGYMKPIISVVRSGDLTIERFEIQSVKQEPQSAFFCYVDYSDYLKDIYLKMCGIGCYAYTEELDWLQEKHPEIHKELCEKTKNYLDKYPYSFFVDDNVWKISFLINNDLLEFPVGVEQPSSEDLYVGTTKKLINKFKNWLMTVADKKYFDKIDFENALRYNAGDAFFVGTEEAMTEPENITLPLIRELI